jgi:hypothetical protein
MMKKVYRILTIFSLLLMLIFGLTFFNYDNIKSYVIFNNKNHLTGDTDGVTSTKLNKLSVDGYSSAFTFNSDTLTYSLNMYKSEYRLKINYEAKDKDATVTISGNEYITDNSGVATITVSNGIEADTTYSINWSKTIQNYDTVTKLVEKNAAGSYSYTPTIDSYYLIEIWGAQGGSTQGYRGGYGGYAQGVVYLTKNDTIYIVTG